MLIQTESYVGVMAGFVAGFASQQFLNEGLQPKLVQLTDPMQRMLRLPVLQGWANHTRVFDNCFHASVLLPQERRSVCLWLAHQPMIEPQPHIVMRFYVAPRPTVGFGDETQRREELLQVRDHSVLPQQLQMGRRLADAACRWLTDLQLPAEGELAQCTQFVW